VPSGVGVDGGVCPVAATIVFASSSEIMPSPSVPALSATASLSEMMP